MKPLPHFAITLTFGLLSVLPAQSAVIYGTAGSTYTQNFDSLASSGAWANDSTITGWYWINNDGTTPAAYLATSASTAVGEQVLSLGNSADRAFGAQNGNGIGTIRYGVQIENSTGGTLTAFSLSYTGEQWRRINENGPDMLTFEYQVFDAGTIDPLAVTTGWTTVGDLDFTNTVFGGSSTGGSLLSSQDLSATITGLTWGDDQELWLRWSDNNPVNNAAGSRRAAMGIDDVVFSAVPEPTSALLLAVGGLIVSLRRRR